MISFKYNIMKQRKMAETKIMHVVSGVLIPVLNKNLIEVLEETMRKESRFILYQAKQDVECNAWHKEPVGPIFAFNRYNLLPYCSDPAKETEGSFIVKNDKIIYLERSPRLEEMEDRHIWAYSSNRFYASLGAIDLVRCFLDEGYTLLKYNLINKTTPSFVYSPTRKSYMNKRNLSSFSLEELTGK